MYRVACRDPGVPAAPEAQEGSIGNRIFVVSDDSGVPRSSTARNQRSGHHGVVTAMRYSRTAISLGSKIGRIPESWNGADGAMVGVARHSQGGRRA